ncbi:MAG TPA: PQQ-binding-like beta-propeller repeat protein [Chloroflexota bacterium]|jgi:ABC-type sugar transport system permease subunit/outer membrane protein assembly factor BamB|nr:PQQ-binding-like beta-propeller repeat protein [Chloroflexota bacterium]
MTRVTAPRELPLVLALLALLLGAVSAQAQEAGGLLWQRQAGGWVTALAASDDGSILVVGSRDDTLVALDREGGVRWSFRAEGSVLGVDTTPDGGRIALASEDRHLYFLDRSGRELWRARAGRSVNNAAVSDDASLVAATADDQKLRAYDGAGKPLWDFDVGIDARGLAVYGTGDDVRVVMGADDATVRVFDRAGTAVLETALDYDVVALAATADGAAVAVVTVGRQAQLLDGATLRPRWTHRAAEDLRAVAVSGDGGLVLVGQRDGAAVLLDGVGGAPLQTLQAGAEVRSVALSRDGGTLLVGTAANQALAIDRRLSASAASAARTQQRLTVAAAAAALLLLLLGLTAAARYTASGRRVWAERSAGPRGLLGEIWRARGSYLLLTPTLLLLLTFNYYPAVSALYHAFTIWEPGVRTTWVGLDNFATLAGDRFFRDSISNVVVITVTSLLKTVTVPLLVAELIFSLRQARAQYWWRTAYVVPLVVPGVAATLVWRNILDPNIGLLNETLRAVGLAEWTHAWLGEPATALWSIVLIGFPWAAAFPILIFYGGLISIPADLFDAGRVDGVSGWRRFWNIDLPLLVSQSKLLFILTFVTSVETFELVFLTTGGGPGSATYTPALELYYAATRFNQMGIASAIGILLFAVVLLVTVLTMRFVKSSVEYQA